ncbi:uncharacterized protein LOC144713026 [Wolffia australiana]
MAGGSSRLRRAARKIWVPCFSLSSAIRPWVVPSSFLSSQKPSMAPAKTFSQPSSGTPTKAKEAVKSVSQAAGSPEKEACAICLEPLAEEPRSVFTAECGHSFHFACVSCNVRFGGVTCPICRAAWSQLPARHDRDDPLRLELLPGPAGPVLSARLLHPRPADVVVVATPGGPNPRLLARAMALVVCALRPADRLAIVAGWGAPAKALPLRRMGQPGKRAALRALDRVFFLGSADPAGGLRKAAQILRDRTHRNPVALVLHLTDGPPSQGPPADVPAPVRRFQVGRETGALEECLWRVVGGSAREARLRIEEEGRVVFLGGMRGGDERLIPLSAAAGGGGGGVVSVGYSYLGGGVEEKMMTGDVILAVPEKIYGPAFVDLFLAAPPPLWPPRLVVA